jgi:hypothetical protein
VNLKIRYSFKDAVAFSMKISLREMGGEDVAWNYLVAGSVLWWILVK